ncbi:MAG: rhamnogalacturonan acetylesterase [Chitinophagaceae bacterium]|nr:rhamnogalacturonan acetylesterase [Chitinophagaceae bacterium]
MTRLFSCLALMLLIFCSFALLKKDKPVFYIIGDSTVRNGDGSGKNQQWGWGSFIAGYFDTTKVSVSNQAIGGRSSRTFITEGRWERITAELKKGDYVIMQFGHNDAGPLDDTARARGTIPGIGEESKDIYNPITKKNETVHTYGWYMRKYIREAKAKGAIAIVCSPVPRDNWKEGKINRSTESYTKWAKDVAKEEQCFFIDLNDLIAIEYETLGAEKVKAFFPADHTHTDKAGAELNASVVIRELKKISSIGLLQFLNK